MDKSDIILKELQTLNQRVNKFETSMATKHDLEGMASKQDLKGLASKQDLENLASKHDLEGLASKHDLEGLATKLEQMSKKLDAVVSQVAHNTEQELVLNDVAQKVINHEMDIRLIKQIITNK